METLILASLSPRRKDILKEIYPLPFSVVDSHFDEENYKTLISDPIELTQILSKEKALSVSKLYPKSFVLGSDTTVSFDDKIFNKPKNKEEAYKMLKQLQGNTHKVITSISLCHKETLLETVTTTSTITILPMTDTEINNYIKTNSPLDKAGAYGLQDKEYIKVKETFSDDDYSNILGFTKSKVLYLINKYINK